MSVTLTSTPLSSIRPFPNCESAKDGIQHTLAPLQPLDSPSNTSSFVLSTSALLDIGVYTPRWATVVLNSNASSQGTLQLAPCIISFVNIVYEERG